MGEVDGLLEHLFRHQYGAIVSRLTRILGPAHLDLAEDAVHDAMLRALKTWPQHGVPANAPAWLARVAYHAAIDRLRRQRRDVPDSLITATLDAPSSEGDATADDSLQMIFLCCHPAIPRDSQVALSLKVVAGLSVREIARAFRVEEVAVTRRLTRARRTIRQHGLALEAPPVSDERLHAVLDVIYFMFNEGYAALEGQDLIRRDLCLEALRLGRLIAASPVATPRVHALVSLIALQAARLAARVDPSGDVILLEHQDRWRWDQRLLALGLDHFRRATSGDEDSPYHVQAAIAVAYAAAPDLGAIDWRLILSLYDRLSAMDPSPIIALNRAVALAKVEGPQAALAAIDALHGRRALSGYHLYAAARGHFLLELGRASDAAECFRAALAMRCSEPERRFLRRKLAECNGLNG
jgi:RNA polymerase sigma-70 factor, ECF subfamily